MNWLRNFMMGRYGGDQLSLALVILSLLLSSVANMLKQPVLSLIAYIPLGVSIYRMLSRNVRKRSMENYKFMMIISPVYSWLKKLPFRIRDLKYHRYFKCPGCKAKLRLPRGKGKIIITCPKCKTEFTKKT